MFNYIPQYLILRRGNQTRTAFHQAVVALLGTRSCIVTQIAGERLQTRLLYHSSLPIGMQWRE